MSCSKLIVPTSERMIYEWNFLNRLSLNLLNLVSEEFLLKLGLSYIKLFWNRSKIFADEATSKHLISVCPWLLVLVIPINIVSIQFCIINYSGLICIRSSTKLSFLIFLISCTQTYPFTDRIVTIQIRLFYYGWS